VNRPTRYVGAVALSILAVGASACTTAQRGSAQPGPVTTTAGAPVTAPHVAVPLSVSLLTDNPCALLTASQLHNLGLTSATRADRTQNSVMTGCAWSDESVGTGVQLNVGWVTPLHHGLADIYVQRTTAAYWQPVTIAGYPGVLTDSTDQRGSGTCGMDLGASNTAVIDLLYQGSSGTTDPCDKVQMLAAEIVSSLKGRS